MASALGRGYDEVTDALRREDVPFVVLYGPDALPDANAGNAPTIELWVSDDPVTIAGVERARGALTGAPPHRLDHPDHPFVPGRRFSVPIWHLDRFFVVAIQPAPEFAAALAGAAAIPEVAGPHPVAASPLRAALFADQKAMRRRTDENLAFDAERHAAMLREQERAFEPRILDLIFEQRAARRSAEAPG